MTFFTRKGLTVPKLPASTGLELSNNSSDNTPDSSAFTCPAQIRTPLQTAPKYADAVAQMAGSGISTTTSTTTPSCAEATTAVAATTEAAMPLSAANDELAHQSTGDENEARFDYVVDRTFGVEV